VRGTKLLAWLIPPIWNDLRRDGLSVPANSTLPQNQKSLLKKTQAVLESIAQDVRDGLLETVGVKSAFSIDDGRCSMVLELPEETDTKLIARAIDAENVEAWCDESGKVHVGINPWYSTKDVDQTVLSTIKVIHVLLGMHAADTEEQPRTFKQKLLKSISEIIRIQKSVRKQ
jgi:hypothetical protein